MTMKENYPKKKLRTLATQSEKKFISKVHNSQTKPMQLATWVKRETQGRLCLINQVRSIQLRSSQAAFIPSQPTVWTLEELMKELGSVLDTETFGGVL
jgi:hypothetical protein